MDSDRRRTFRAQLKTLVEATLVVGKQTHEVRVVDQSAGGMMVAVSTRLPISVDDVVQLRTRDSATEMRVARVENRGMGMRVGLEMLRELSPPKPSQDQAGTSKAVRMYRWVGPSVLPMMVFGVLFVAATVMVAALQQAPPTRDEVSTLSSLFRQRNAEHQDIALPHVNLDPQVRRAIRNQDGLGIFRLPDVVNALQLSPDQCAELERLNEREQALVGSPMDHAAKQELLRLQADALDVLTHGQRQQLRAMLRESVSSLYLVDQMAREQWPRANSRQLIGRLGAAALTLPRVIDQLQLSAQQTARIQLIVETALDESQQLYNQSHSSTTPEEYHARANQLLQQALTEALQELTPQQRDKLDAMRE